jgi:large repetitive protein
MKRFQSAALLMCIVSVLSACGGGGGGTSGAGGGGGGSRVATHFSVTAPTTVSISTFFSVTVLALDASNRTVTGYSGTVHFTSSDPQAVLSGDSTLTNGAGTFSASLAGPGSETITATDTLTSTITGSSNPVEVANNSGVHGFQPTGAMGIERAAHTATLLANGKVLIAGGFNSTANLASAEVYDPAAGAFVVTGTMTTARSSHTATLLANGPAATNGKVLITGGSDASGDLATAELFDPATGTFTATGAMSELRSEHTATLLANGKVLLACGTADNVAELFDPATGTFASTASKMLTPGRWGCTATLLNDGTVLITGGRDAENVFDGGPINTAELFNPATGIFTASGVMTQFRYGHTAALLNNGKVFLAGGINGNSLQGAELFDPTTKTFSMTGLMSTARVHHTATLLNDGTVLVAGGFTFVTISGGIATADVFDTATGMFTPAGPMGTARFLHTATRLNDGQVLITGGQSNGTGVTASSAELYR